MSNIKGLDLTEVGFDTENARLTAELQGRGINCDTYAYKSNPTQKGFWLPIIEVYKDLFTQSQLDSAVEYIPIEEEEETYEI